MFSQGGLSLEQAPPISVVMRFFIMATSFGLLLGVFLLIDKLEIASNFVQNSQLVVVHILALGVMASFMLGALFQMLPVIAGVVIKFPTKQATIVQLLFLVGLLLQLFLFATKQNPPLLYFLASAYLGGGLLYASFLMLKELIQIKDHSSSSKGMIFALIGFILALSVGVYLLLTLGGFTTGSLFLEFKEIHYSFALFGWISLLIVSVSFQVIEMFYITPKYPNFMSKYLTLSIFTLLIMKSISLIIGIDSQAITLLIFTLFIIYASITLHRLYKRKRPTSDATVWFWRLGMGLLIVSMSITSIGLFITLNHQLELISYLTFIGFALSVIFAMVYKIVPFLTWFHLSNQGYMEAPMMHDVIHPKKAKIHFYIHVAMLSIWTVALTLDVIILNILGSITIIASFGWLLYNLIFAVKKYNYTQKHTEKFEW